MTEKTQFLGFMFPKVVQRHYYERWDKKSLIDSILIQQYLCQKLPQSVMCVEVVACKINVVFCYPTQSVLSPGPIPVPFTFIQFHIHTAKALTHLQLSKFKLVASHSFHRTPT